MKTTTIQLYSFNELSSQAQQRALDAYNNYNDMPFLSDYLFEYFLEELKTYNIERVDNKQARLFYSLGYSQGDGLMFQGTFKKDGYTITVQHSGHYYHSNSKDITIVDDNGEDAPQNTYNDFEDIYQKICKTLEKLGYDYIDSERSIENFQEVCELNNYTFEANGNMRNE